MIAAPTNRRIAAPPHAGGLYRADSPGHRRSRPLLRLRAHVALLDAGPHRSARRRRAIPSNIPNRPRPRACSASIISSPRPSRRSIPAATRAAWNAKPSCCTAPYLKGHLKGDRVTVGIRAEDVRVHAGETRAGGQLLAGRPQARTSERTRDRPPAIRRRDLRRGVAREYEQQKDNRSWQVELPPARTARLLADAAEIASRIRTACRSGARAFVRGADTRPAHGAPWRNPARRRRSRRRRPQAPRHLRRNRSLHDRRDYRRHRLPARKARPQVPRFRQGRRHILRPARATRGARRRARKFQAARPRTVSGNRRQESAADARLPRDGRRRICSMSSG